MLWTIFYREKLGIGMDGRALFAWAALARRKGSSLQTSGKDTAEKWPSKLSCKI